MKWIDHDFEIYEIFPINTLNSMSDHETLNDGDDTEKTLLVKDKQSWTRLDKLLLIFGVLVNFGDGVEIYLPGSLKQMPE